ncbi:MAG: aminotransferase class V-fold PLP-dependent enzyme [Leucobacter sp.]
MTPVIDAVSTQLKEWAQGDFSWTDWDLEPDATKQQFARLLGLGLGTVSSINSVADGIGSIATSFVDGTVVIPEYEYQSILLPFDRNASHHLRVHRVSSVDGVTTTDQIIEAIDSDCVLVAVSDCLSSNGSRLDLPRLGLACRAKGARLLVDVTQSLGVLNYDFASIQPDFILAHGYKWIGAPRGAAWMWSSPGAWNELRAASPSWRNRERPFDYFGGELSESMDAQRKLDGSHGWLAWRGAGAALSVMEKLDFHSVELHTYALRDRWEAGARGLGFVPVSRERASHISVLEGPPLESSKLHDAGLRLLHSGSRLRAGFHYFNDHAEVDRGLETLEHALRGE